MPRSSGDIAPDRALSPPGQYELGIGSRGAAPYACTPPQPSRITYPLPVGVIAIARAMSHPGQYVVLGGRLVAEPNRWTAPKPSRIAYPRPSGMTAIPRAMSNENAGWPKPGAPPSGITLPFPRNA